MTEQSLAPRARPRSSTRHHTVDSRFAGILQADFGIPAERIMEALEGEPQRQGIEICGWAEGTDEPARALINWAKKHRKGAYRPRRRDWSPEEVEASRALFHRLRGNRKMKRGRA